MIPVAGPPRDATLPSPAERVLDNGLRVVAFSERNLPLIAAQLILGCGAAAEREDEAGLSAMVAALLTQGTQTRSATELAAASDALGARLGAGSGYDASIVSAGATTPAFSHAFALLEDVVRHPAFAPAEFERMRTRTLSDLTLTYANPSALARAVAQRVAYGGAPYGHPTSGTAATLRALDRERVAWFHERFYRPDDATLVIGGDLGVDDAFALADRVLGAWRAPSFPIGERPHGAAPPPREQVVIVDKPDAGRTALVAGRVALERRSPDYYAATVATAVLSGYSGRLNQEIRVKRGLSYGAHASLAARRGAGTLLASTLVDHTRAAEATEVTLATLRSLVDAPPSDEDLVARKATVTGSFFRAIETVDGIASAIGEHVVYAVPLGDMQHFAQRVESVEASAVRDCAARALVPDSFVVLVGDASKFAGGVAHVNGPVRTIPVDELDLGSPSLRASGP
ncbi:MAG TPA: pitrilysin family protein [Candidatus Elarobacter sp.]|nr:pitrilysin family protein [Candidatus Elarobacter sp.]